MVDKEKKCSKCGVVKQIEEFSFRNDAQSFRSQCKECRKQEKKKYYEKNKDRIKLLNKKYIKINKEKIKIRSEKYREKNKEKINLKKKKYYYDNIEKLKEKEKEKYIKNKEKIKKRTALWYHNNKEKAKKYHKEYRENNKEQLKKYKLKNKEYFKLVKNKYEKQRKKNDPNYKLRYLLRKRLLNALNSQNVKKNNSIVKLLGCTILELKKHLESKFQPGMSWENHGVKTWHIDHIRPCASFDLTDSDQQAMCFNWSNLQPLWAIDNLRKSSKNL